MGGLFVFLEGIQWKGTSVCLMLRAARKVIRRSRYSNGSKTITGMRRCEARTA